MVELLIAANPDGGSRLPYLLRVPLAGGDLQVRWPNVPIVFCETRQLAEEWTYRFLAAAHTWAVTESAVLERISSMDLGVVEPEGARFVPGPTTAEVRAWARGAGLPVPDRGRLRPEIWSAWHEANPSGRIQGT